MKGFSVRRRRKKKNLKASRAKIKKHLPPLSFLSLLFFFSHPSESTRASVACVQFQSGTEAYAAFIVSPYCSLPKLFSDPSSRRAKFSERSATCSSAVFAV